MSKIASEKNLIFFCLESEQGLEKPTVKDY